MQIQNWIEKIIATEQSQPNIIACYFGLFEGKNGYTIYLIGSSQFDEEDSDWACNNDFEPSDKYFVLPDEYQVLEWHDVLNKVVESLKKFQSTNTFKKSFLFNARIATGFDDGDLVMVK